MTNEEAVSILEKMWAEVEYYEETEALDMAIEALSNSQKQDNSEFKTKADSVSEADVIYRADAIEELRDVIVKDVQFGDELTDGYNDGIDMAITVISKLPSAQPERQIRRWIRRDCGLDVECKCSRCGYKDFVEPRDEYWFKRNYYPNCGAKMGGKPNE